MNEKVFLKNCSRCGEDHPIVINKLTTPIDNYMYFAMCPILKEPILLKFIPDDVKIVEEVPDEEVPGFFDFKIRDFESASKYVTKIEDNTNHYLYEVEFYKQYP